MSGETGIEEAFAKISTKSSNVEQTSQSRILPHIPLEILMKISKNLDIPEALSLCRTCKSLRDAGEVKIWETVDITSGWDPESDDVFDTSAALVDRYRNRATTVDKKLNAILSALGAYPFRLECINTLRLEPSDGNDSDRAFKMVRLLEKLEQQITRLDILPLAWGHIWDVGTHPDIAHKWFMRLFDEANFTFPNLTYLKYAAGREGDTASTKWFERIQSLEEIEYCSADLEGYRGWDISPLRKSLLKLKRLTFNHVDEPESPDSMGVLSSLLSITPNLEYLRLKGVWHPRQRDSALKAMSGMEKLKTVVAVQGSDAIGIVGPGMDDEGGMEYSLFGKLKMGFEEAAFENLGWDEMNELRFESLRLPRASNLQRVTILTTPRLPLEDYILAGVGPILQKTAHISLYFFQYILRNPTLSTVLFLFLEEPFPRTYARVREEPEYFVTPARWEAEGHRGAIIRQYSSGRVGEDFWHVRALSRALDHKSGMSMVGFKRHWQDFTSFRARTVPRHIVEQAYAEAGLEMDWLEGGRGMELGQDGSGWRTLREWRETAGDESEIEDDFTDEDLEGTEADTDEDEDDDDDDNSDIGWAPAQSLMGNAAVDSDGWADTDDDGDYDEESDDPLGM